MVTDKALCELRPILTIFSNVHGNGNISLILNNSANREVIVSALTLTVGGCQVHSSTIIPFTIGPQSRMELVFEMGDTEGGLAILNVEYYDDFNVRSLSSTFSVGGDC